MSRVRVLDVGQCNPDHAGIRSLLEANFEVEIDRVMHVHEALAALAKRRYALVLVNRLIFEDQSDGMELVRRMKSEAATASTPVMLISNFPDAQARAVEAGAVPGFGKNALTSPQTVSLLAAYLPAKSGVTTVRA